MIRIDFARWLHHRSVVLPNPIEAMAANGVSMGAVSSDVAHHVK